MNHQLAPSQPRRTARTLARLGGLAVFLAAAIGLAPAAWATYPPLEPSLAPVRPLPPPAAAPAYFPLWAIAALLAAIVALSVATTLITLALEHARQVRRAEEAATEPRPGEPAPFIPSASGAERAEILSSHPARDRA